MPILLQKSKRISQNIPKNRKKSLRFFLERFHVFKNPAFYPQCLLSRQIPGTWRFTKKTSTFSTILPNWPSKNLEDNILRKKTPNIKCWGLGLQGVRMEWPQSGISPKACAAFHPVGPKPEDWMTPKAFSHKRKGNISQSASAMGYLSVPSMEPYCERK